jgi:hypothetical protein
VQWNSLARAFGASSFDSLCIRKFAANVHFFLVACQIPQDRRAETEKSKRCIDISCRPAYEEQYSLMKKVRFGLIGFGAWGTHHARARLETPKAERYLSSGTDFVASRRKWELPRKRPAVFCVAPLAVYSPFSAEAWARV